MSWGLPPFLQATQSLKVMNQGSLVIDLAGGGNVVWRGVAQAKLKLDTDFKKREAILREGVRDLLKRFPPKQRMMRRRRRTPDRGVRAGALRCPGPDAARLPGRCRSNRTR